MAAQGVGKTTDSSSNNKRLLKDEHTDEHRRAVLRSAMSIISDALNVLDVFGVGGVDHQIPDFGPR